MLDMGMELKVLRVRARARQQDVAEAMGLSVMRISMIEHQRNLRPSTVERYKKAIDDITGTDRHDTTI